jgi:acyl-CoA thioesterase
MVIDQRLPEHFALADCGDHYVGHAPDCWAFRGRMFGGYTAAAALLAAARWAPPGAVALTAAVSFLSAAEVGSYRVETTDIRTGRSSTAVNVRLRQNEQTRLTLSAWFVRPDLLPQARDLPADIPAAPPPDRCARTWRDDKNPFDAAYQRRAVHYPAAHSDYPSHGPDIDLWIRLVDPWSCASTSQRQAADLLMIDAHMAETLVDGLRVDPTRSFSIDLAVRWSNAVVAGDVAESTVDWHRLRVHREARGRIGLTSAQLLNRQQVAADATQHVAIGPPCDTRE